MNLWKIEVAFVCLTAFLSACSAAEEETTESRSLALGPGPATLLSPSGTTTSQPSYSWTEVAGATSYRVWVNDSTAAPKINQVVAAGTVCLGGGTCTFTPATSLATGAGKWWVQAISTEAGPWSSALSFSVPAGSATLIAPVGTTTQTPTFQWSAVGVGAIFELYVNDASGVGVINQNLSAAALGCDGATGTCSFPSPVSLAAGGGKWWLRVNGGPWGSAVSFTVNAGVPTPVSPSGTITTATPNFQWTSVPGAVGYQLWVNDAITSGVISQTYTPAQAGCAAGGTCQISPGVSLASGPGKFWVKLSNSLTWSAVMNFTVTTCTSCSGPTTRVSVGSGGAEAPFGGSWPALSSDGRYVAFVTGSPLVANDTNATGDVFVHDRSTGETTLVSVATDGTQGDTYSTSPSISADGRYVAFYSQSTTLVAGDTNFDYDVFVRDRNTNQTTRVSVASDGTEGSGWMPAISADGRYVAFSSSAPNLVAFDTNAATDVFVHDRTTGQTTRVSVGLGGNQGDGYSDAPSISADGRYVAFYSGSTNLVLGDTNGTADVFVHDRSSGQTTRASITSGGAQGNGQSLNPSISANGDIVAFYSDSNNLVAGDTNDVDDVFVHVRGAGHTTRVSVATDGTEGNSYSYWPSISADGLSVVYRSEATNLVSGDVNGFDDVFLRRISTSATSLVSLSWDNQQGNDASFLGVLSGDGSIAVFASAAGNLVFGDTNGGEDCFARLLPP